MVGVGIFLFECEGYAGAPDSARIASVCGKMLVGWKSIGTVMFALGLRDLRMSTLLGGARKILPISSVMIAMAW